MPLADVKALLRPNQPSSNDSLPPPVISRKSPSFFQNMSVDAWPALCDDITRGAEGKEIGRRTSFGVDRDKPEPYLINYPAKHSCLEERLNAGLAHFYYRLFLSFPFSVKRTEALLTCVVY